MQLLYEINPCVIVWEFQVPEELLSMFVFPRRPPILVCSFDFYEILTKTVRSLSNGQNRFCDLASFQDMLLKYDRVLASENFERV